MDQISRRLKFALERWVQRGAFHQLVFMALLIALVAVVGGIAAWMLTEQFEGPFLAVWWAFLRLTDPGYLGDDEGATLRVISTIVTVLGYVLFMGSLIAIMTQWLARTIRSLERGLTPIALRGHVVILGWTNRTPEIVRKLLGARGRLERFLARRSVRKLRVVILADDVGAELRLELRGHLKEEWDESQVFLLSGSSLQNEHLERVDLRRASAVLIPGADFELGGALLTDARVVKTLLAIQSFVEDDPPEVRPHVVAEIFDPRKVVLARTTLEEGLEIVASERILSRLILQSVRQRGMAQLLVRLLSHREGSSLYLRGFPELAGRSPHELADAFPQAIPLGLLRREGGRLRVHIDPTRDVVLQADDDLVLLAETYEGCRPITASAAATAPAAAPPGRAAPAATAHRLLILGWSYKIGTLVAELGASDSTRCEVTVMSRVDLAERERVLGAGAGSRGKVRIHHVVGDYSIEPELAKVDPAGFDNVLLLASRGMGSSEEADARTILGYVLVRSLVKKAPSRPEILAELLDPANSHLIEAGDAVLVSPRILSHLLAHVALRPELNPVFDELFRADGPEFAFLPVEDVGLAGRTLAFSEAQTLARGWRCVAVGIHSAGGDRPGVYLNPPRDRRWTLAAGDRLVVLRAPGAVVG